jgi:AraC-like DNA-binding protein
MMQATEMFAEATVMRTRPEPLDDAMDDLRISGSVLLTETYAAPWAIDIPDEARLRELLRLDADTRVLLFHFVRRGAFDIRVKGARAMSVAAAEVAICPTGVAHAMSCGKGAKALSIEAVLRGERPGVQPGDGAQATELVCGVFMVRAAPLNPMLGALPSVLKVATGDATFSPMLAGVAWMLAHEIDRGALGSFASARLLEMFFAEAIRAYQRTEGAQRTGWFRGLADARVCDAMRRVHESPSTNWTVAALASAVALSPSRFAARFREMTGQSVMAYVVRWRVNVACRLLRDTELNLTDIAGRIGYESLPAFSRAFKAQLGEPPAAWRAARGGRSRSSARHLLGSSGHG